MMADHCCLESIHKHSTKFILVVTLLVQLADSTFSENNTSSVEEVFVTIGDSPLSRSGLVELSFDGVTWSRIDPEYDEWKVGSVVCRHKGFGPPSFATSTFTSIDDQRLLTSCRGNEMTLSECQFETNYTSYSSMVLRVSCLPSQGEEFDVALAEKYTFVNGGIVLTFVDGRWGPICAPQYSSRKVCRAICKQLLYKDCQDYPTFTGYGINIQELPALGELECGDNAVSVNACRFKRLQNQSCQYPEDQYLDISCSNYYGYNHDYVTYENDINDYLPPHKDYELIANGQVMAVIAFVVTAFLCVMFYLCRKSHVETTTMAASRTQQNYGDSVSSASLLQQYRSSVIPQCSRGAPPGSDTGLYPTQSGPAYPPHHQPDNSLSYPIMPPPAYTSNEQIEAAPSEGPPQVMDPELPTYEEAVANKTDI